MSAPAQTPSSAVSRPAWSSRLLSLPTVMGLALVEMVGYFASPGGPVRSVSDPDIWWHLRNAAQMLQTRHFIHTDFTTFTVAGKPWIDFEWLAELPWYGVYRWLGDRGLYLLMMVLASAIVLGIFYLGWLRARDAMASFMATAVATLFITVSLAPRTLLFGWLFLVIELGILWAFQRGRDHTAWLPLLFLLWINTHGSWFIGFVLMLVYFACGFIGFERGNLYATRWTAAQARKVSIVAAAAFALLFVNPYGWRLVTYPLDVIFHQKGTMEYIIEWASLDFHTVRGKTVLLTLMLLGVLQLVHRRRWLLQDLAFLALSVYGAFTSVRFVFLAGIVVGPLLAMEFARQPGNRTPAKPAANPARERIFAATMIAVLMALMVIHYPNRRNLHAAIAQDYPEQSLPYLRSIAGQGPLFNEFRWGGYLEWELPQIRTFIDPRNDIFVHHGVMDGYANAVHVQDTFAVLDKYHIRYALLAKNSPMAYLLQHNSDWKIAYQDKQAVVFERAQ